MILKDYVKIREEKFGTIIFETLKEKVFVTNEIGKRILNMLLSGNTVEEIIKDFKSSYDANENEIEKDIRDFISELKDKGIII
ncbi:MAG: PqqD family protein [Candidatus Hydrogenedentota bacterium]